MARKNLITQNVHFIRNWALQYENAFDRAEYSVCSMQYGGDIFAVAWYYLMLVVCNYIGIAWTVLISWFVIMCTKFISTQSEPRFSRSKDWNAYIYPSPKKYMYAETANENARTKCICRTAILTVAVLQCTLLSAINVKRDRYWAENEANKQIGELR